MLGFPEALLGLVLGGTLGVSLGTPPTPFGSPLGLLPCVLVGLPVGTPTNLGLPRW